MPSEIDYSDMELFIQGNAVFIQGTQSFILQGNHLFIQLEVNKLFIYCTVQGNELFIEGNELLISGILQSIFIQGNGLFMYKEMSC